ncbi:MAG TPA: lysylphosphatidylglycerol synthase transmembrane domain-containing protein [Dehalococcoidia bacterium]|nr:lysylphosphatidylglycerol synthase transmembrane domain-containing protein [Dehalococcoidia bacterium]
MKRSFWLRWLAGLAILAFLILRTDFDEVFDALGDADASIWLIVVPLNLVTLALATLRSKLVVQHMRHDVPAGILFSSVTLGFVAGSLTPAASGELLRTDALRATAGVPVEDGLALVAFERLMSFYLMLLSAAATGAILVLPPLPAGVVVAVCIAAVALPCLAPKLLRLLPPAGDMPSSVRGKLVHYVRTTAGRMEGLFQERTLVGAWSLVTLGTFAVVAVQFWLMAESLGGGLDLIESLFAYGGSQVLSILSLLPLGIGVSDGALVAITERSGMAHDEAIAMAVLVRATIMLPLVLLAVSSYFHLTLIRSRNTVPTPPPAPEHSAEGLAD